MRTLLKNILKNLAKQIIKKYQPTVIGITGSVGKTSAKMAAAAIMGRTFQVRASEKSYNNEFGLPLTIIGASSQQSKAGWLFLFVRGLWLLAFKNKNYPEMLILEMGADHPGDLDYLLDIAPPSVGVLTGISAAHTEFFKSIKGVQKEKQKIVMRLQKDGIAVLNADDPLVMELKDKMKTDVVTYGFNPDADVRVVEHKVLYGFENNDAFPAGVHFKVLYKGSLVPMEIKGVMGDAAVSTAVAGVAISIACGMNLVDIAHSLEYYDSPSGRMRLVAGVKQTLLIDDTYNSSPKAALAALAAFDAVHLQKPAERWVVFGDMRELGPLSEEAHREVGHAVAVHAPDHMVAVGELAKEIASAAIEAGMNEEYVYEFPDARHAARFIQDKMTAGSAFLVKGSQAVRMERAVKELMADPLAAGRLLVRQESGWLR